MSTFTTYLRHSRTRVGSRHVARRAAAPSEATHASGAAAKPVKYALACPICQTTTFSISQIQSQKPQGNLSCQRCDREFASPEKYVDLTLTSGMGKSSYTESLWNGTELFRRPAVSSVYERGWRQGFAWAGFPGVETEYAYAMEYLAPQYGETLVDMSCGSGLFTRRFAKSGQFDKVVAVDFSESMLAQTDAFIQEDASVEQDKVLLLRADIGRLPFETASVAAMHAGAAIHCWPNPSAAVAEISRVLKPGGVFVGSTFLDGTAPLGEFFGDDKLVAPLKAFDITTTMVARQYRWWSEAELKDLFASVGLTSFQKKRSFRFILWTVRKPDPRDVSDIASSEAA